MRWRDVLGGRLLLLVLDRIAARPEPSEVAAGSRRRRRSSGSRSRRRAVLTEEARPVRRGPLFGLMVAAAAVAVPLMIIFEHPVTRVIGVLGLFTFIISGVFLIADPAFLEVDEDDLGAGVTRP